MTEAIVMLLLNTGLPVDELVTLTCQHIQLHARSGWIDVVGKGDKHRRQPLNVKARKALRAIQPVHVDGDGGAVFGGKRGPYTARGSSTWSSSWAGADRFRMCIHIVSVMTRLADWSSRSTCPPWRRG